MKIFTIGHSTRNFEEFVGILKHYSIELLVDIRRFPSSKIFPHFNREHLEKELPANEIEYFHFPELGGFRKEGYEAFSKSEEFNQAIEKLLEIIDNKITAIMCAEILWWRCHRRYIANILSHMRHQLIHIFDKEKIQEHKLRSKGVEEKMKVKIFCDKTKNVTCVTKI